MPTKERKPINSSSRFQTYLTFEEITKDRPHKALTKGKSSSGGRNNKGQLTSWWRGGGHKHTDDPVRSNTAPLSVHFG